jgi:hypothetical protein
MADGSDLFGSFYGHDFSSEECDRRGLLYIDSKLFRGEPELINKRWFDYRFMHPIKATYLFAFYYRNAYRKFFKQTADIREAKQKGGFRGIDCLTQNKQTAHGFLRARQHADRLGIPYDFYVFEAMRLAISKLWQKPPRPAHLYSDEFSTAIQIAWDEELSVCVRLPIHGFYRTPGAHIFKAQFKQWLAGQILARSAPEFMLAYAVERDRMLSWFEAEAIFDPGLVARAKRLL